MPQVLPNVEQQRPQSMVQWLSLSLLLRRLLLMSLFLLQLLLLLHLLAILLHDAHLFRNYFSSPPSMSLLLL